MDAIASLITSLTIVYSTVYSDADQRKHQSSASLAFVWGIHRRPVNSPHKWPVTRKMVPFDDVIMHYCNTTIGETLIIILHSELCQRAMNTYLHVLILYGGNMAHVKTPSPKETEELTHWYCCGRPGNQAIVKMILTLSIWAYLLYT